MLTTFGLICLAKHYWLMIIVKLTLLAIQQNLVRDALFVK